MTDINGVMLVNKPSGITSQKLISIIKKKLNVNKIGHAGTLDPLATGLMIVLIGSATKLSDYLMSNEKEYICEILIGSKSDSEDIEGNIIEEKEVKEIKNIDEVLNSLVGTLSQVPPMYSSVHHNGVKLYELARRGIEVERTPRIIEVNNIQRLTDIIYYNSKAKFSFKTSVSKGTYIRTLCVEIGNRLNYPALMNKLERTKSGIFDIKDSYTIDDILNDNYKILSNYEAIKNKDLYFLTIEEYNEVKNGKMIKINNDKNELFLIYNNDLIAIYEKHNESLYKAKRVWN